MSRVETTPGPGAEAPVVAKDKLAELREQEAVFQRKLPRLLKSHRGEYVAVYRGRVVAHGPDDEELARQMYKRYGDVVLLIARVEEEPTVYEIPSPEDVR
ncbi:MAG: hypothetical protein FJ290_29125 [Planctomycetes bacterium]|nr:hypothetical protein [Planctomycetota bacterium]